MAAVESLKPVEDGSEVTTGSFVVVSGLVVPKLNDGVFTLASAGFGAAAPNPVKAGACFGAVMLRLAALEDDVSEVVDSAGFLSAGVPNENVGAFAGSGASAGF